MANRYIYTHKTTGDIYLQIEAESQPEWNPKWGNEIDYTVSSVSADADISARLATKNSNRDTLQAEKDAVTSGKSRLAIALSKRDDDTWWQNLTDSQLRAGLQDLVKILYSRLK